MLRLAILTASGRLATFAGALVALIASSADRVVLLADGRLAGDVTDPRPEVLLDNLARLGG